MRAAIRTQQIGLFVERLRGAVRERRGVIGMAVPPAHVLEHGPRGNGVSHRSVERWQRVVDEHVEVRATLDTRPEVAAQGRHVTHEMQTNERVAVGVDGLGAEWIRAAGWLEPGHGRDGLGATREQERATQQATRATNDLEHDETSQPGRTAKEDANTTTEPDQGHTDRRHTAPLSGAAAGMCRYLLACRSRRRGYAWDRDTGTNPPCRPGVSGRATSLHSTCASAWG